MKNEIVKTLPKHLQPPSNCVCIDCMHAHWHLQSTGAVECKCRLLSVLVWKVSRAEHCITACSGSETLQLEENPIPCVSCQYAVWYKDSGKLQGYCRDIYRKIYGQDMKGDNIHSIGMCNSYEKMEVL